MGGVQGSGQKGRVLREGGRILLFFIKNFVPALNGGFTVIANAPTPFPVLDSEGEDVMVVENATSGSPQHQRHSTGERKRHVLEKHEPIS